MAMFRPWRSEIRLGNDETWEEMWADWEESLEDDHKRILRNIESISSAREEGIESAKTSISTGFDDDFGALNVIFAGDPCQLPPVKNHPLHHEAKRLQDGDEFVHVGPADAHQCESGLQKWREITTVVELKKFMRQAQDPEWMRLCVKARTANWTEDDLDYPAAKVVSTESQGIDISAWVDNPSDGPQLITYLNATRDAHNDICSELFHAAKHPSSEIHRYWAEDSRRKRSLDNTLLAEFAWRGSVKTAGDLSPYLIWTKGMPVYLTSNICTAMNLANGAAGTVVHWRWESFQHRGEERRRATEVVLDVPTYRGPDLGLGRPTYVVLHPISESGTIFSIRGVRLSATRSQLPIIPSFASTIHCSQGRSLQCAVLDLQSALETRGNSVRAPLLYVMLSRIRRGNGVHVLTPFNYRWPSLDVNVRSEIDRLMELDEDQKLLDYADFGPILNRFR